MDDQSSQQGGQQACQQVASNGSFAALAYAGLNGADVAAMDCLDKRGIPMLGHSPESVNPRWDKACAVMSSEAYSAPLAGFIQNVIKDGGGKIGVLRSDFERDQNKRNGFVQAAKAAGLKIVREETYSPNSTNLIPQLQRLAQAGVTTLVFFGGLEYVTAHRQATAIGFTPKWVGNEWAVDTLIPICRELRV